jgi:hypothetical protein
VPTFVKLFILLSSKLPARRLLIAVAAVAAAAVVSLIDRCTGDDSGRAR